MRRGLRLTRASVRATAIEHAALVVSVWLGVAFSARPLPLLDGLGMEAYSAPVWACLVACCAGTCLRTAFPGLDDVPRPRNTTWAGSRLLVVLGVLAMGFITGAGAIRGDTDVFALFARDTLALAGIVLLLVRLPMIVWSAVPWMWVLLALYAGHGPTGELRAWAILVEVPDRAWTPAVVILLVGAAWWVIGESLRGLSGWTRQTRPKD